MNEMDISDERLAALADDELPAGEAAELRGRIARDPDLAERFALFAETRALLAPDRSGAAVDQGHDRLAAMIRLADAESSPAPRRAFAVIEGGAGAPRPGPAATPMQAPQARPVARFRVAAPALAAAFALAVGGVLGFAAGRGGSSPDGGGDIAAVAGAPGASLALTAALDGAPSGERRVWSDDASKLKGAVSVVSTHRLGDGRICREYEISVDGRDGGVVGLGCRQSEGRWATEAIARNAGTSGYATASGASLVEGAIESMGGQGALSSAEEGELLSKRWSAPKS